MMPKPKTSTRPIAAAPAEARPILEELRKIVLTTDSEGGGEDQLGRAVLPASR